MTTAPPTAMSAEDIIAMVRTGVSGRRDVEVAPRFAPGDQVVARHIHTKGHTRLPRYIRGRTGQVVTDHGVFGLPDSVVAGTGESPQHVYSVRFEARELWGPEASPRDSLYIDMWDDYMDLAGEVS